MIYAVYILPFSSKPEVSDSSTQPVIQDTPWTKIDPAAQNSPHAILPEETFRAPAGALLPLRRESEQTLTNAPVLEKVEHVRVTAPASIRDGPSASTTLLGVAQAGANAQVISRQEDWVQIIDPNSKKTGWIQSSFLETHDQPGLPALSKEEIEAALDTPGEVDFLASKPSEHSVKPRKSKKNGWKHHRKRGFAFRRLLRRVW